MHNTNSNQYIAPESRVNFPTLINGVKVIDD